MLLHLVLTVLATVIFFARASTIPGSGASGLGLLSRDNGTDINLIVRDDSAIAAPFHEILCGCGYDMNNGDTDAAVEILKNELDSYEVIGGIPKDTTVQAIKGDVVVFVCNPDVKTRISRENFRKMLATITDACGEYIAGTWWSVETIGITHFEWYAGYMRYDAAHPDFCGAALLSNKHHC